MPEIDKTQADWAPQSWFAAQAQDNGAASYFGHEQSGYQRFRHAHLADMINMVAGTMGRGALLDVGCAAGVLTDRIRRRFGFARAVGADFVSEVLERGRLAFPEIEFMEAALPDLPLGKPEFDLIVASEVLYYLTPDAQKRAIEVLARLLRPGGYLLVGSALGGPYFSPQGIFDLLEQEFEVVGIDRLHMRIYHALVAPFYYSNRLDSLLSRGAQPGSAEMQARFTRIRSFLAIFPIRYLVHLLALCGRPVIVSEVLPAVANSLSVWSTPSNIAVLGRRR